MKRISVSCALLLAAPALAQEAATEAAAPLPLESAGSMDEGAPGIAGVAVATDADPGAFRVHLRGSYFSQADFGGTGGDLAGLGSQIGVAYAVSPALHLGVAAAAASHHGTALGAKELQALGDIQLGATWVPLRGRVLSAGARGGFTLFSGTEPFAAYAATVSPYADVIATFRTGPIRTSLNAGFLFDRSEELLEDGTVLDPAQRAAYGVSAGPHARAALAVEAPLFAGRATPFAAARSRFWMGDASGDDAHVVAAGLRLAAPMKGRALALELGADVALSGDDPEPERPVTPRTRGFVALSLYSPQPKAIRIVEAAPPPAPVAVAAKPTHGEVKGTVRDATSGEPLAYAIVDVPGRTTNMILTDASGNFRIGELPPGAAKLRAQKTGYGVVLSDVTIAAGATATAEVTLSPASKSTTGAFTGNVKSPSGVAVAATMTFQLGSEKRTVKCDATGRFSAPLPPGTFQVTVDAPGFVAQSKTITVNAGEQTVFNFVLQPSS